MLSASHLQEGVKRPQLPATTWRAAQLGIFDKADDIASYLEAEARRWACYEGSFCTLGRRSCPLARAVYSNNDVYIGPYKNDCREGLGMYVFANGGAFAGVLCLQQCRGCSFA
jgi:hypothetical protein